MIIESNTIVMGVLGGIIIGLTIARIADFVADRGEE